MPQNPYLRILSIYKYIIDAAVTRHGNVLNRCEIGMLHVHINAGGILKHHLI